MVKRKQKRTQLAEEDAVRLFLAHAEDLGATIDARSAAPLVRRIVALVGHDRVGVQLAAARAKTTPLDALVRALETLDETDLDDIEHRVRLTRGEAMRRAGKLKEAARELTRVVKEAARDPHARAEAHMRLGSVLRARGKPDDALAHKEEAVRLFADLGDRARLALAEGEVGVALVALGRLGEARARHERAIAAHRELGARGDEGVQLSYLGVTLHRLGLFAEARRAHEAALAIHRETGNVRLEGADHLHLGYVAHETFALEEARAHFDAAAELLSTAGDRALLGVTYSYAGALAVEARRREDSGALLHRALSLHAEAGSQRHEAMTRLHLAYHHADLGETDHARSSLERALALGRGVVEAEHEAWMLALLGRLDDAAKIRIEDPCTIHAIDLVELGAAFGAGTASAASVSAKLPEPGAIGTRVRRAAAMAKAAIHGATRAFEVAADGAWFISEDGTTIDLRRRTPLRKALVLLVEHRQSAPGEGVSWETLLRAGWPGERVLSEAGFARVRNALFQLRKLGVQRALVTGNNGYFLDPTIPVRVVEAHRDGRD
jgi:tetratricopeptide (TPR) repeat protein